MGGYDRRRHVNRKKVVSQRLYPSKVDTSYAIGQSASTVVSYRSNPAGEVVLDKDADPYAWFLNTSSRSRRDAAKRHRLLGSQEPPILDTGHTFSIVKNEVLPLNGKGIWFPWARSSSSCYGGPVLTGYCEIGYLAAPRMLFTYGMHSSVARKVTCKPLGPSFDPNYWGQKAITQLAPTRPSVNMAVALGEVLREGIPNGILDNLSKMATGHFASLKRLKPPRTKSPMTFGQALAHDGKSLVRAASGDYLNYMFGIMPLVRDMDRLYRVLLKANEIIAQYERDAGKGVRRSMTLEDRTRREIFTPSDLSSQGTVGLLPGLYPVQSGGSTTTDSSQPQAISTTITQTRIERTWFSGSFSYYLPVPSGYAGRVEHGISLWTRLYGAPVSWEALWALKPWSWLVDWLVDVQTLIASAETVQDSNLVLNYGYIMHSVTMMSLVESDVTWYESQLGGIRRVRTLYSSEWKTRYRANPFGFSLKTPGALSGVQWSLLAAIGFTR